MTLPLNHIAIKVNDLETCSAFYERLLNQKPFKINLAADGQVYSHWFKLAMGLLMLEKTQLAPQNKRGFGNQEQAGLHLLSFHITPEQRMWWQKKLDTLGIKIEKYSEYSLYFYDPEGNPLALSHYPQPYT